MVPRIAQLRPRTLFAIDAVGAAVSALVLGLVLPRFESLVGMPPATLYLLAVVPVVFLLYDVGCLLTGRAERPAYLLPIALANLGYCVLSVGYLVRHREHLTPLGWTYFVIEIVVVVALATLEIRAHRSR
ncbi:MAG: hypothetical protein ACKV2T_09090 [Kofleriaceae bacterium]